MRHCIVSDTVSVCVCVQCCIHSQFHEFIVDSRCNSPESVRARSLSGTLERCCRLTHLFCVKREVPLSLRHSLFTQQEFVKHFIFHSAQSGWQCARSNVFTYNAAKLLKATLLPLI